MKQAILFVGHGTRLKEGIEEFMTFTNRVQQRLVNLFLTSGQTPVTVFERSFLELQAPNIEEGLLRCVAQGATHIHLAPVFLFSAGHMKHDIPQALEDARVHLPDVTVTLGQAMGMDMAFRSACLSRLEEVLTAEHSAQLTAGSGVEPLPSVLFVGRGSKDREAHAQFLELAKQIQAASHVAFVEPCFLAGYGPRPEEALDLCVARGAKRILVLPYLLFKGRLTHGLPAQIQAWQRHFPDVTCRIAEHLGLHDKLIERFAERTFTSIQ